MHGFQIGKESLVEVVERCQNRTFAEELDALVGHSTTPTDWLCRGTFVEELRTSHER